MVTLNGQSRTVAGPGYTLQLEKGFNKVRVEGLQACKGIFEGSFFRMDSPLVAPNPFREVLEIRVPDSQAKVGIRVFSLAGTLVWGGERRPQAGIIALDLPGLPTGWYLVEVDQGGKQSIYKVRRE